MIPGEKPSNKKSFIIFIVIGVIIVILTGLGIWYWQSQKNEVVAPAVNIPAASVTDQLSPNIIEGDSTSVINQELDNIGINDLNKEFQSIDADLGVL